MNEKKIKHNDNKDLIQRVTWKKLFQMINNEFRIMISIWNCNLKTNIILTFYLRHFNGSSASAK